MEKGIALHESDSTQQPRLPVLPVPPVLLVEATSVAEAVGVEEEDRTPNLRNVRRPRHRRPMQPGKILGPGWPSIWQSRRIQFR